MGNLDEDSGTVSGFRVAAAGAAVCKVDQDLDAFADDVMALVSTDAGHKSHAAGVVLMVGVVQTLSRGQTIERFVLLSQPSLSPFI